MGGEGRNAGDRRSHGHVAGYGGLTDPRIPHQFLGRDLHIEGGAWDSLDVGQDVLYAVRIGTGYPVQVSAALTMRTRSNGLAIPLARLTRRHGVVSIRGVSVRSNRDAHSTVAGRYRVEGRYSAR